LIELRGHCDRHGNPPDTVSWGTKGFEPETGSLLSDVAEKCFSGNTRFAVITGPSFARELARRLPTTLAVASHDSVTAHAVAGWLKNPMLKAYTNTDIIGTQVGGAVKNVMAIATGICDGMGLGANARAGLITRGLAELTRMGQALGGQTETFMGLSGLGDLILTCTDDQSRNRRVGLGLGSGQTLPQILSDIGQEAEGVITTKTVHMLAQKLRIEMPITQAVYRVLYENLNPKKGVSELLARELKSEY
jgi:glycerol-3-phosphate dehydrogenase (NAD(P)+)